MIYTVTFNPALDYVLKLDNLLLGKTNRSFAEEIQIGGKGINVSLVLSELGVENKAFGFLAGFTGEHILNLAKEKGINADFVLLKSGETRINVKIKAETETEINASGPEISQKDLEAFWEKLSKIGSGDILVLSGSIPKSLPTNIYEQIMERFDGRGIKICVDASGKLLQNCLKYKPFVIKPNKAELEELAGRKLESEEDVISEALKLKIMGAVNVLVSMGADGAVLIDEYGKIHKIQPHKIKAINTVGAGDSMLAGFIVGTSRDYEYALKLGNAAGAATAASNTIAKNHEIMRLM